jgi:hypothetical protein
MATTDATYGAIAIDPGASRALREALDLIGGAER